MNITGYHFERDMLARVDSTGRNELHRPGGEPQAMLGWLLARSDGIHILWNLDFSVACLLRAMDIGPVMLHKLWEKREIEYIAGSLVYTIGYIKGKSLAITVGKGRGAPTMRFADAYQYHKEELDHDEPDAGQCTAHAQKALSIGQAVHACLVSLGLNPARITSPVNTYENNMDDLHLPELAHIPEEAAELAYRCCYGGWTEAYQLGHWEQVYDYDISSAYPSVLATLPDISTWHNVNGEQVPVEYGRWVKSAIRPPKAMLGFLEGTVTVNRSPSPVIYQDADANNYTPTGTWPTCIGLDMLDYLYRSKTGTFIADTAWWWIPTAPIRLPMRDEVHRLYAAKQAASGLEREVIKRILTGIYGKLLEVWATGEMGNRFNPVWAAPTEERTRIRVAEFAAAARRERRANLLHIAVDGCILDRKVPLPDGPVSLGSWHLAGSGPCTIAGSGVVAFNNRNANPNARDFTLNHDKLTAIINADPTSMSYAMTRQGFISAGVADDDNRCEELGDRETISRTIDIDGESKRYYPVLPASGADLLSGTFPSEPWDIHLLAPPTLTATAKEAQ